MGWKCATILGDGVLAQAIQFALAEEGKNSQVDAKFLVDVILSPVIQLRFQQSGIDRPSISTHTAHPWLAKLGWQYGKQWNGMYIDRHEHEDIMEYRSKFVERFHQYEQHFHIWDNDGNELPRPSGFPVPEAYRASGCFCLVLITHDILVFFQNDQCKYMWHNTGKSTAPRPKGEGQLLMVFDFLTADWGCLHDKDRCALFCFSSWSSLIFLKQSPHILQARKKSWWLVFSQWFTLAGRPCDRHFRG